jgi:pimeloyl-ACP methyl ester carboxylesterase
MVSSSILAGSRFRSREGALALCSELPRAKLLEISGAGHNVHVEKPVEVLAALREHLRGDEHGAQPVSKEVRP